VVSPAKPGRLEAFFRRAVVLMDALNGLRQRCRAISV
jgi:hypothetical protein